MSKSDKSGIRCNWGAIFCGTFLTLACMATAMLLANGLNLSPLNAIDPRVSGSLRVGSWIYTCATSLLSFFLGGLFCTRIARIANRREGALYGIVCWAVTGVSVMFIGVTESMIFNLILTGEGPPAGNWLLIAVAVLGAAASAWGGALGSSIGAMRPSVTIARPAEERGEGARAA